MGIHIHNLVMIQKDGETYIASKADLEGLMIIQ